ncbi:hypothetical protein BD309DRAFT_965000 [Dichomitus squalens]|uniref:Uncharacterized protein n=1 Tax=Dichomitus squalens TaxID=114155 RepID=A0A4Q9PR15_9APHY|nr:hypothetical protein BD309DRAFT_965000 [Dichomitus squalens]TBU56705.1 hypothetical protein BD310DRAFT_930890 [Dichomitus squalens]
MASVLSVACTLRLLVSRSCPIWQTPTLLVSFPALDRISTHCCPLPYLTSHLTSHHKRCLSLDSVVLRCIIAISTIVHARIPLYFSPYPSCTFTTPRCPSCRLSVPYPPP